MFNVLRTICTCHYSNKRFLRVRLLKQWYSFSVSYTDYTQKCLFLYTLSHIVSICNLSKLTGKNAVLSLNLHLTINKVKNLFMFIGYFFFVYYIFLLYTNFFFSCGVTSFSLLVFGNFVYHR